MSEVQTFGYNIGLELTNCYTAYFNHRETELNGMIDNLKMTNMQVKLVSDVINKLAHSKQKNKQADLNEDEIAKKCAYLIHLRNTSVFEDKIHGVQEVGMTLDQKFSEIITQLKEDGYSDSEIRLETILDRVQIPNIRIDVLSEDEIDVVMQGLDAENKMLTADLNEHMMKINNKYEDRSQMTENARQVLKEADEHNKSIIHKTSGR
jgi:hypothetical protein